MCLNSPRAPSTALIFFKLLHTAHQPGDLGPRDLSCRRSLQNTFSGPTEPATAVTLRPCRTQFHNTVETAAPDCKSRQCLFLASKKNKAKRKRPLRSVQQRMASDHQLRFALVSWLPLVQTCLLKLKQGKVQEPQKLSVTL